MQEQLEKTIETTFYKLLTKSNVEFYMEISLFLN